MLHIAEEDLETMLQATYQRGTSQGIKQMEKRLLHACKEGNPLDIRGRAFFVKSDVDHLRDIFADLESEGEMIK